MDAQQRVLEAHAPPGVRAALALDADRLEIGYLREHAPRTIRSTLAGTERVATIVRAMREFAHPDQVEMVATDVNRALEATLEVARNEYKYVADVETAFGELPLVRCHAGELNQVYLNVIVNAAHAIGDVVRGTGGRGRIRIATSCDDEAVLVDVSDTGGGIPRALQDKVFEPFFTTKPVGKGTGQGLPLCRALLEKHRGSIRFESEPGRGTTFHIRLPIDGGAPPGEATA
jgi:two-component system NtrC family sensor kinase